MLKADGYNHGAEEIMRAAGDLVDLYGVASASEGAFLRSIGANKPILVTVFLPADAKMAAEFKLTPIVYDKLQLKTIQCAAKQLNTRVYAHIKVDTGMNRLGVKTLSEYQALLKYSEQFPNVIIEGICTHFYDNAREVLDKQKEKFERFIGIRSGLTVHAAASGSAFKEKSLQYDFVRIGIAAYGYSELSGIQPVMNSLSTVISVKAVKKGEVSGYSAIYKAEKDTNLAIIEGGYYDGITRNFVGANVILGGKFNKIVAICMDTFIVDVGNLDIKAGDKVIILGTLGRLRNTAECIGKLAGTVPYEILTGFKGRAQRIYYD
jgi:alanine racemase